MSNDVYIVYTLLKAIFNGINSDEVIEEDSPLGCVLSQLRENGGNTDEIN